MSEQTPPLNPFWVAPLRSDPDRARRLAKKIRDAAPPKQTKPKREEEDLGLACPQCGCKASDVLASRPTILKKVWRRRECLHCGHRFTTTEKVIGKKSQSATGSTQPKNLD